MQTAFEEILLLKFSIIIYTFTINFSIIMIENKFWAYENKYNNKI